MIKQRPILFSTPMIQPLQTGLKTQTRRKVKLQPVKRTNIAETADCWFWHGTKKQGHLRGFSLAEFTKSLAKYCPYGQIGDILWVRETFLDAEDYACSDYNPNNPDSEPRFSFKADCPQDQWDVYQWKPSIHMPYVASRLFLKITDVRVELLQDISDSDAIAEGCEIGADGFPKEQPHSSGIGWVGWDDAREWYSWLWEEINGPESWDANPFVWVVSFERCEKPSGKELLL